MPYDFLGDFVWGFGATFGVLRFCWILFRLLVPFFWGEGVFFWFVCFFGGMLLCFLDCFLLVWPLFWWCFGVCFCLSECFMSFCFASCSVTVLFCKVLVFVAE